ncbi:CBS domain-containing protein [Devosia sp. UYZn731]|uniref:CBS domain-containing protein n=1 Tax=Devosia sp. UYZn731 TaxID=3156345 RepID=UPI003398DF28
MSTLQNETLLVADVMLGMGKFPVVAPCTFLKPALEEMGKARLGIICISGPEGGLDGILTDGDLRRQLLRMQKPFSAFFADDVIDHAVLSPTTVLDTASLRSALDIMEAKQVWDLPVLNEAGRLVGLLHLHRVVQKLLGQNA